MVKQNVESLTSRQRELLEYIETYFQKEQRLPSYREMAKAMKVSAVGTIQDHVRQLREKGYLRPDSGKIKLSERLSSPMIAIPIVGTVAAGPMTDVYESAMGTMPLSKHELGLAYQGRKNLTGTFVALKVSGESMVDAGILPGDFVIVDRKAEVKNKDIVVIAQGSEATVKELETVKGKPYKLHPKNSSMKPFLVEESEDVRIIGKVVALRRIYSN